MSEVRKPSFKKRFPWGWLILGLLAAAAMLGLVASKNAPMSLAVTSPTVFRSGDRNPVLTASGYIVARHRATLSAKVPGRVAWLGVEEGTRVSRGQVIARLEDLDTRALRDQVAVNLDQAETDLKRAESLAKDGIQDRSTLDHARANRDALRAQLKNLDAQMENMVLRAPFAGTITQKLSEVGETVSPGSAGGANAINAVAVLDDFDSLEVEVEVNESGILKLSNGMPAEIRVDALADKVLKGKVREIYPTSNRQKAVVIVRVAFIDKAPHLLPDMGAKVTFQGESFTRDVVVIGREQVVKRGGKPFVWILRDGQAQLQPITLGQDNPIGFEVEGLSPDAQLLVAPPDALAPGAKVKVKAS